MSETAFRPSVRLNEERLSSQTGIRSAQSSECDLQLMRAKPENWSANL